MSIVESFLLGSKERKRIPKGNKPQEVAEREWRTMFFKSIRNIFRTRFEVAFGFRPTGLPALRQMEQKRIEGHLTGLAKVYALADKKERILAAEGDLLFRETNFGNALKSRADRLRKQHRILEKAKKAFWNAQKLAKKEGYLVRSRYSDYLPPGY